MQDLIEQVRPTEVQVFLYKPTAPFSFPIEHLAVYLQDLLGEKLVNRQVEVRREFLQNYMITDESANTRKELAQQLATCRIEDLKTRTIPVDNDEKVRIFHAAMELNLLEGISPNRSRDHLYHGPRLMNLFRKFVPGSERTTGQIHIIFTDRLFCTWSDSDARYHARASMLGFPHLISMPGIVEAPARPREYYIKRHLYASSGLSPDELEAEFAGLYLIYKDQRTLEVIKGYTLQALFYTLFLDPFCTDRSCRLFNAHWQADLLHSQLESGSLCDKHKQKLKDWINS